LACSAIRLFFGGYNEAEREDWAQTRARGKRPFILREVVFNIALRQGVTAVVGFTDRPRPFSVRSVALTAVAMLPVFLLGWLLERTMEVE